LGGRRAGRTFPRRLTFARSCMKPSHLYRTPTPVRRVKCHLTSSRNLTPLCTQTQGRFLFFLFSICMQLELRPLVPSSRSSPGGRLRSSGQMWLKGTNSPDRRVGPSYSLLSRRCFRGGRVHHHHACGPPTLLVSRGMGSSLPDIPAGSPLIALFLQFYARE
jgi:hypothetical protein